MHSASKTALRKSGGAETQQTNTETEVKLRIADGALFLRRLARLKAKLTRPRVHEMNTLYDTGEADLARQGRMLRLRVERSAAHASGTAKTAKPRRKQPESLAWLTFKGPAKGEQGRPGPYKVREEHEVRIFDHEEMPKILEALGLRQWFRYEKFRSTYELPGLSGVKLEFDETPIGAFVELEGERSQIDRAAELLGFSSADYINKSYGALFMEACGLRAGRAPSASEPSPVSNLPDMLFRV